MTRGRRVQTLRHLPGFVSFNFHLSLDRTQIVNYGQWGSREAVAAARQDPRIVATEQDKQEYVRHLCEVGGISGALGGYRDVFTTEAHLAKLKNQKLTLPVLGVSGEFGVQGVAEALRSYAERVEEAIIPGSGHFVAEEQPQALLEVMLAFFETH